MSLPPETKRRHRIDSKGATPIRKSRRGASVSGRGPTTWRRSTSANDRDSDGPGVAVYLEKVSRIGKVKTIMRYASVLFWLLVAGPALAADGPGLTGVVRSAQSGPWSAATTWEGGKVPGALSRVHVRSGHTIVYD